MNSEAVITAHPIDLEVRPFNDGYALCLGGEILKTRSGRSEVVHSAPALLGHMAREFDGHGALQMKGGSIVDPVFLGAYGLFEIQKEWVEPKQDDLSKDFGLHLVNDPVLNHLAGPEQIDRMARWHVVIDWLAEDYKALSNLTESLLYSASLSQMQPDEVRERVAEAPSVARLESDYLSLSPEERVVVMMLFAHHEGVVIWPMALVRGLCTADEYALGVMACHALLSGVFGDITTSEHADTFKGLRDNARTALDYIKYFREGTKHQRLREIIELGEGPKVEFKSTLRWNLKANKKDDAITHACVKTIAAFLNTKGGNLLVGVGDDGAVLGIGKDDFQNDDKLLLFLWDKLKTALGESVSAHVSTEVIPVSLNKVLVIECKPSGEPVYCKTKGGNEDFYIRIGPGTSALTHSEMVKYMKERFKGDNR